MELPPLSKDLHQPSRKGSLKCFVCGRTPHSFCSLSLPGLRGCNRPFCKAHGIVHRGSEFEVGILEKGKEEKLAELPPNEQVLHSDLRRAIVRNFSLPSEEEDHLRLCQDCMRRQEESLRNQILLRVAWASFWILASLTLLFILVTSLTTISCGAESESYCHMNASAASQQNYSRSELTKWVQYREPKVSYCEYRQERENYWSLGPRYFTCQCLTLENLSFEAFNNETLKCEKIDCPPNEMGTQYFIPWVLGYHRCEIYRSLAPLETYRDPVYNVTCPSFAKYYPEANLCTKVDCSDFGKVAKDGNCMPCPPYLQRRYSASADCLFRPQDEELIRFEYLGIPLNRHHKLCPVLSANEIAENETIKVNMEVKGYAYSVKDLYGYYQCLVTNEDTVRRNSQRICVWQEMVVRTLIGCHSPCIECKQKWDFTRKMCVPADLCSSLKNLRLTTWGQCTRRGKWSPLATGEKFCS